MTTLGKVIIGIGAAVVGVATVAAVKKHHDKKQEEKSSNDIYEENSKQDLKDSIKTHMAKKTVDILTFVGKHEKEIKEATMLLSAIAAAVELIGGLKKLRSTRQMTKDISWIKTKLADAATNPTYDEGYNACLYQVKCRLDQCLDDGKPYAIVFGDNSFLYNVKAV